MEKQVLEHRWQLWGLQIVQKQVAVYRARSGKITCPEFTEHSSHLQHLQWQKNLRARHTETFRGSCKLHENYQQDTRHRMRTVHTEAVQDPPQDKHTTINRASSRSLIAVGTESDLAWDRCHCPGALQENACCVPKLLGYCGVWVFFAVYHMLGIQQRKVTISHRRRVGQVKDRTYLCACFTVASATLLCLVQRQNCEVMHVGCPHRDSRRKKYHTVEAWLKMQTAQ